LKFTLIDEIEQIHSDLRKGFLSGKLKSMTYRKQQILNLAYLLKDNIERFQKAFEADLGRAALESDFLEINATITEVKGAYYGVEKWAKPEKPPLSINWTAMRPVTRKEPKGVVLIISPFNYPIWLSLAPFAGAIAAGNAAVIKPSELAPTISSLFAELFPKYLDPELFRVVNGAVPETTELLELQWDHILYTGSGRVAKVVATAAAKHLTPISLEVGKSPVIVDPKCDVKIAAKRILWGKMANAGQTCVAPDYILVPQEFQDPLVDALTEVYHSFYPSGPAESNSFARIITVNHAERIKRLLDSSKGTIVVGGPGECDASKKYIAPTIVKDVGADDSLMSEEIFGPVLPIVPVKDLDEAIKFANARDHPLALYVFSIENSTKKKVFDNTQSGACVANEVLIHVAAEGLPFGGTGPSGSGYYTGKYSFHMFTHL
ncbi:hypothetical protein JAAARDRAFT_128720, partial [Jaapia argillacea MUCL 33604]